MNVFSTEHPLESQSDDKTFSFASYCLGVLLVTGFVSPILAIVIWWLDAGDNGGSTGGYTPDPFWVDLLVAAFVVSFIACLGAAVIALGPEIYRGLKKRG